MVDSYGDGWNAGDAYLDIDGVAYTIAAYTGSGSAEVFLEDTSVASMVTDSWAVEISWELDCGAAGTLYSEAYSNFSTVAVDLSSLAVPAVSCCSTGAYDLAGDCCEDALDDFGSCCAADAIDTCGVCGGDAVTEADCIDCAGTALGDAALNECGVCVGGDSVEVDDCVADTQDPPAYCATAELDCADVCFGASAEDNCATCDDDASNDCVQDCVGTWGGDALSRSVAVQYYTGAWASEKSWEIVDSVSGDVLLSVSNGGNGNTIDYTFDMPADGSVDITLTDSYGDGWNGGYLTVDGVVYEQTSTASGGAGASDTYADVSIDGWCADCADGTVVDPFGACCEASAQDCAGVCDGPGAEFGGGEICEYTCYWEGDGDCDDGRPGAPYSGCDYGTDCADCGVGTAPVECCAEGFDAAGVCGGDCTADIDSDGVCDTDDTCIGEADECGTCDMDPTNDCEQDCNGAWGGDAVSDVCGTCDNDATNDDITVLTFTLGLWDESGSDVRDSAYQVCGSFEGLGSWRCVDANAPSSDLSYERTFTVEVQNAYGLDFAYKYTRDGGFESFGGDRTYSIAACAAAVSVSHYDGTETDCYVVAGGPDNWHGNVDNCGVCNGDVADDCVVDCAGVPGGDSWLSDCGCVAASNSGDECDDCAGTPDGSAVADECGTCDDDASNDCEQDICGEWGGDGSTCAYGVACADGTDIYGCDSVCGSGLDYGATTVTWSMSGGDYCQERGFGIWDGTEYVVAFGAPFGLDAISSWTSGACPDTTGGTFVLPPGDYEVYTWDSYDDGWGGGVLLLNGIEVAEPAIGGMPEMTVVTIDPDTTNACAVYDCHYEADGTASTDECGTCVGGTTGVDACVQDCNGDWGGAAVADMCDTCDADASNDCVQDCNGDWGGIAEVDNCGDCAGGLTGVEACVLLVYGDACDSDADDVDDSTLGCDDVCGSGADYGWTTVAWSMSGGNWCNERSWEVTDTSGAVVASGSGYSGTGACADSVNGAFTLAPGTYTLDLQDSYGDGWDGYDGASSSPGTMIVAGVGYDMGADNSTTHELVIQDDLTMTCGVYDCEGTLDGSAALDCAGVCNGSSVTDSADTCCDASEVACDGVCNSGAFVDACATCVPAGDDSCSVAVPGCTNADASNYDSLATEDDGSCTRAWTVTVSDNYGDDWQHELTLVDMDGVPATIDGLEGNVIGPVADSGSAHWAVSFTVHIAWDAGLAYDGNCLAWCGENDYWISSGGGSQALAFDNGNLTNSGTAYAPGMACDSGMVDCSGNCITDSYLFDYNTDGYCDGASALYGIDLYCPEFGNDGGDCDSICSYTAGSTCSDNNLNGYSCSDLEGYGIDCYPERMCGMCYNAP
jgi:hypothetical protein